MNMAISKQLKDLSNGTPFRLDTAADVYIRSEATGGITVTGDPAIADPVQVTNIGTGVMAIKPGATVIYPANDVKVTN